jgi:hypothetical protein
MYKDLTRPPVGSLERPKMSGFERAPQCEPEREK